MLARTIDDVVDNYQASAGDAAADLWRGYLSPGKWQKWSGTWPRVSEPMPMHLISAMIQVSTSALVSKQGVIARLAKVISNGQGVIYLSPLLSPIQGYDGLLLFGEDDSKWGYAAAFPKGSLATADVCQTRLTFRRYLP